ncbi:MAG: DNA-processing protein DprA [Woeseiaceae bacterium]
MTQKDKSAWQILAVASAYSGLRVAKLLAWLGSAGNIVKATNSQLESAGATRRQIEVLRSVPDDICERINEWRAAPGHHFLTLADPGYPEQLRPFNDAPAALFVAGDPDLLSMPALAVVGSRNPTASGRETATRFSEYLAKNGLCIVSGLAEGIDTAAHTGALAADGATIAVLGTGIDICYPEKNHALYEKVAKAGTLISEYPPGRTARAWQFPARNRIISGLSMGTLVVEATQRSGSLITARLAGEQGRAVFAIPGSIHNPLARGCHQLIRQGALLVEQAADVFAELGPQLNSPSPSEPEQTTAGPDTIDKEHLAVLESMGWDPVSMDTLVERTGLTTAELSSMLLIMELKGSVRTEPGGQYQRCESG